MTRVGAVQERSIKSVTGQGSRFPVYNFSVEAIATFLSKFLSIKMVVLVLATGVTVAMLWHLKSLKFRLRGRNDTK